ncbi:MAG: two-component regulator propeller domain-containing protein [Prolixibacteraceae bacterium]
MKINFNHRSTIVLFLWFITLNLSAQIGSFRNINSEGLVDFQVNSLFKDAKGFIWTGGAYKIQRFDGKYIKVYENPANANVHDIVESTEGTLFFATSKGLYSLSRTSSDIELVLSSKLVEEIYSLYIDSVNTIFAGTENGLAIIKNGALEKIQIHSTGFPYNQVLSVKNISDKLLCLLTPGGIVVFNKETKTNKYYPLLTASNNSYFTCMTMVDSVLYIGTNGAGIFAFNSVNGELKSFLNIGNGVVTCISSDNKSKLYTGTAGTGVFLISIPEKKIYRSFNANPESKEKLSSGLITTLLVDDFGILWVGSSEHLGFDYMFLEPKPFMHYSTSSFSTNNVPINQFYLGQGFKLLTGSYGLYYVSDDDGVVQRYEAGIGKAKFLKPGNVLTIAAYNDKIILGGECGIYAFNPSDLSLTVFEPLATLSNATIYHMNLDSDGNLWVASSAGLSILNGETNQLRTYNTLNSNLPNDLVRFIYFDKQQRIWICTNKGICFWDQVKKDFYPGTFPENFIQSNIVHSIMEDRKGNFLFCYNERYVMFSKADFSQFRQVCTEEDAGFSGLRILKVLQEESGAFWFIGSRGGIKANESLTHFEMYSISEGLFEPYATDGHFDLNGGLWLSNNEGLYYPSGNFKRNNAPMAITEIKVNGSSKMNEIYRDVEHEVPILFKRNENNIEFQFALLDYTRPDLMVYECMLLEVDSQWNILRGLNKIHYKDLAPGKYTFIVRHNMDKRTTLKVFFEVQPLFSKLEFALVGVIFFLIAIGGYRYIKSKRKNVYKAGLAQKTKDTPEDQKYQFNKISQDKADKIIRKLRICMDEKQMYLNTKLKMSDLANEVECSNQILSQVFNLFLNEKYNEFINRYRINEFKRIVSTTDHSMFTIKSVAQKSGFSSYTSFYRAFKEQAGITPNEFIQNFNS